MNEFLQESDLGTIGYDGPTSQEARRAYALDLAVRIHCARADGHPTLVHTHGDRDVLETADRFAAYISGGEGD